MQRILQFSLAALFILTPALFSAADKPNDEPPKDVAMRLQQRYDNIESLILNFQQETQGGMLGRPKKVDGQALFLKNKTSNRMRWDYSGPDSQVMVSDGRQFFIYSSNLQQMIVTSAKTLESDPTYSFFSGTGNLLRDFKIHQADEDIISQAENDYTIIKLTPKTDQSQVQDIHLWASEDSLLRRIIIRDHFGTITILNFSDIEIDNLKNKSPAQIEALFSFSPPDNTEIIHQ